jgi:hypothetical protein
MAGKITVNSRYANVDKLFENNGDIIFVAPRRPIPNKDYADNIIHTVKSVDRLDLLSSEFYGTPQYGWIIADFNNLLFPDGTGEASLLDQERILIPSLQTIEEKIL